jgi:hypothetical protein
MASMLEPACTWICGRTPTFEGVSTGADDISEMVLTGGERGD